jgi:hypothetical protein
MLRAVIAGSNRPGGSPEVVILVRLVAFLELALDSDVGNAEALREVFA